MVLQSGIYSFRLLTTGNLTLRCNNTILYYNQGLNSSYNASSPILGLQSVGILSISDQILSIGFFFFLISGFVLLELGMCNYGSYSRHI